MRALNLTSLGANITKVNVDNYLLNNNISRNEISSITVSHNAIIGDYALSGFNHCIKLGGTQYVKAYGNYSMADCSELTAINLSSAISVGNHAFENCITLKNVDAVQPNNLVIGNYAFKNCYNLVKFYNISQLTSIPSNMFENCRNYKFSSNFKCKSIGNYAFDGCTNFPSKITLDNCTEIGRYAFRGCKNLESLIAPNCTFVDYNAFYGTKLWNVDPS